MKRSEGLWRFACGDVLMMASPMANVVQILQLFRSCLHNNCSKSVQHDQCKLEQHKIDHAMYKYLVSTFAITCSSPLNFNQKIFLIASVKHRHKHCFPVSCLLGVKGVFLCIFLYYFFWSGQCFLMTLIKWFKSYSSLKVFSKCLNLCHFMCLCL